MEVLSILNNQLSRIGGAGLGVESKDRVRWKNAQPAENLTGQCDNYIVASTVCQNGDTWGEKTTHPKSDKRHLRTSSLPAAQVPCMRLPSARPLHSLDWRVIFEDTSFLHEGALDEIHCRECLRRQGVFRQNGSAAGPQWADNSPQSPWIRNLDGHAVK
jgi:hypothetical protein